MLVLSIPAVKKYWISEVSNIKHMVLQVERVEYYMVVISFAEHGLGSQRRGRGKGVAVIVGGRLLVVGCLLYVVSCLLFVV